MSPIAETGCHSLYSVKKCDLVDDVKSDRQYLVGLREVAYMADVRQI